MRDAASSMPMNIAGGCGRGSPRDQDQIMRAVDLGDCNEIFEIASLLDEVCAMLLVLRKKVLARRK